MVTGQLPFTADSNYAMMAAHLQEVPKPPIVLRPGIPQALNQIIVMALAKDPGQRFQSADAFRGALKSVPAQGAATQAGADPRAFVPSANAGSATALFQETPASQSPTTVMDTPAYRQTPHVAAAASPAAAAPAGDLPQAPPPQVSGSGHRGLYIALGAFIVVAVLFAAGLYLPSHIKTLAGAGKSAPASQQASSSATSPSSSTSPVSPDVTTPSPVTPATPDPAAPTASEAATAAASGAQAVQSGQSSPDSSNASSTTSTDTVPSTSAAPNSGGASAQPAKKPSPAKSKKDNQAAQADAQAKAEEAAAVEENEHRYDDIDSRSAAVSTSLDNIQRQQAAAGYGLRGDIVSAQQRMRTDLGKAQAAMQKQDTKAAKKYLDMAEAELTTIEKFLGK
jgi:serine/threonine-protein kinase